LQKEVTDTFELPGNGKKKRVEKRGRGGSVTERPQKDRPGSTRGKTRTSGEDEGDKETKGEAQKEKSRQYLHKRKSQRPQLMSRKRKGHPKKREVGSQNTETSAGRGPARKRGIWLKYGQCPSCPEAANVSPQKAHEESTVRFEEETEEKTWTTKKGEGRSVNDPPPPKGHTPIET